MFKSKILIISAFALIPFISMAASFDCDKAKSFSEKAICSDPNLSSADDSLASLYRKAKEVYPDQGEFKKLTTSLWNLRESCASEQCVIRWFRTAAYFYHDVATDSSFNKNSSEDAPSVMGDQAVSPSPVRAEKKLTEGEIYFMCKNAIKVEVLSAKAANYSLNGSHEAYRLARSEALKFASEIGYSDDGVDVIIGSDKQGISQGNKQIKFLSSIDLDGFGGDVVISPLVDGCTKNPSSIIRNYSEN